MPAGVMRLGNAAGSIAAAAAGWAPANEAAAPQLPHALCVWPGVARRGVRGEQRRGAASSGAAAGESLTAPVCSLAGAASH